MTATVSIVRRHSGFQNVPDSFLIQEPGAWVDDYNESVAEYVLPAGYRVARSVLGTLEIYGSDNRHCEIVMHSSGRPQIVGRDGMPVLRQAVDSATAE